MSAPLLSQNQKPHQTLQRPCRPMSRSLSQTSLPKKFFFFLCLVFSSECLAHSKWWCRYTNLNSSSASWKVAAATVIQDNEHDVDPPSTTVNSCSLDSSTEECLRTRGGSSTLTRTEGAEKVIKKYLSDQEPSAGKFLIQGWRWHNLSLVRDTGRLERLANHLLRISSSSVDNDIGQKIDKASYHVIDFNMKDLDAIERKTFFPWLKETLAKYINDEEVAKAFTAVLDEIEKDRDFLAKIGKTVRDQCKIASSTENLSQVIESVTNVSQMSAALTTRARSIFDRIERLIVPAVALLVSKKEQKHIDNKILFNLGIFQSRTHLVGMHEAVWELEGDGKKERKLFEEMIPYFAQRMIPRWKHSLYEPQAGVLDI